MPDRMMLLGRFLRKHFQTILSARGMTLLVLLASTVLAACAGVSYVGPTYGGAPWRELTSDHFTLTTDLIPDQARAALTELETYRAAIIATAYRYAPERATGRIPVIAVNRTEYAAFAPSGFLGAAFSDLLYSPRICMASGEKIEDRHTIVHELFHFVSRHYVSKQPKWLAEGLAQYYETIVYDKSRNELTAGVITQNMINAYWGNLPIRIDQMVGEKANDVSPDSFYPYSFMLTLYLLNNEPTRFARYQLVLKRSRLSPVDSWRAIFSDEETRKMDDLVRDFAKRGEYVSNTQAFKPPPIEIRERPLSDVDTHAQRALLRVMARGSSKLTESMANDIRKELEEGLAQDPHHVMSLAVSALLLGRVNVASVVEATQRHADDWLAWAVLARIKEAQGGKEAARQAWARATSLAQMNPEITLPPIGPSK